MRPIKRPNKTQNIDYDAIDQEQIDFMFKNWDGYQKTGYTTKILQINVDTYVKLRDRFFGEMTHEAKNRLSALANNSRHCWTVKQEDIIRDVISGNITVDDAADKIGVTSIQILNKVDAIKNQASIEKIKNLVDDVRVGKLTNDQSKDLEWWARSKIEFDELIKETGLPVSHLIVHAEKEHKMGYTAFQEYKELVKSRVLIGVSRE